MLPQVQYAAAAFRHLQDEAILEGMLGKSHIFDSCFSPDNIISSVPKNDFYSTFITQIITARNVFKDRFIDVDLEEIYVLVPFELWLSLFSPENATLKDYVNHESFRTGIIEALPGIRFIVMDKVPGSDFFPTKTQFPGLIDPQFEPDTKDEKGIVKER